MRVVQLTALAALLVLAVHSETLTNSLRQQAASYDTKTKILLELLDKECPNYSTAKRELTEDRLKLDVDVQKIRYERLANTLIKCRKKNDQNKPTITSELLTSRARRETSGKSCL